MQSNRAAWWFLAICIFYVFSLRNDIAGLRAQVESLHDEVSAQQHKVSELRGALEEANTKIRNAQAALGASYEEQQDAMEELEEVEEP